MVSALARSQAIGLPVARLNASPFRAADSTVLRKLHRLIPVYPSLAAAIAAGTPAAPVPVTPGSGIPRAAQPEDLDRGRCQGRRA